jgi:hypothetical protein
MAEYPELAGQLAGLPLKVFSGKANPKPDSRAVFFCYRIPRPDSTLKDTDTDQSLWSDAAGLTVWACFDLEGEMVLTDAGAIATLIRTTFDTPRKTVIEHSTLSELRKKVEKQLISEFLRPLQAPVGVSPVLKCWMELN